MPVQAEIPWLSIVPIAESRSSYNGLLVFAFIALSASLAVLVIHRLGLACSAPGAGLGLRLPDEPDNAVHRGSFAQPIRRVFGNPAVPRSETVEMPPPGDQRPARLHVRIHDLVWEYIYAPVAGAVGFTADRLNHLQFLTIRRYLSLVFLALVVPCWWWRYGHDPRSPGAGRRWRSSCCWRRCSPASSARSRRGC
jgi:hydrogenase-4 component B